MGKLTYAAVAVLLLGATTANAQDDNQKPAAHTITVGYTFSAGYDFTFWGTTEFTNIPQPLRTVTYSPGYVQTFDADHFGSNMAMIPLKVGLVINIRNRVEIEGGLSILGMGVNDGKQIVSGCYCEGSTVTYFQVVESSLYFNKYFRASVQVSGPLWIRAEAQLSNSKRDITWKQGYSQYGDDETLSTKTIATRTLPFTGLVGISLCMCDNDEDEAARLNFMGGVSRSHTTISPEFPDLRFTGSDQSFVFEISADLRFNFRKKHK